MANIPGKGVPIIGPWVGRIGQVADIMATPCSVSPEVWVLAFIAGVPRMAVGLFKPTPDDYISDRIGSPHKKKRRGIFLVEDLLEPAIPTKGFGWIVFRLGAWAERVGWWFAIIDAGIELSYHWSSMAYQWSGCAVPEAAGARLVFSLPQYAVNNGDFWGNWNVVNAIAPVTADIGGITVPPLMRGSISNKMTVEPAAFGTPKAKQVVVELVDTKSGTVMWQEDLRPREGFPATLRQIKRQWIGNDPERRYQIRQVFADGYYKVDAEMEFYGSQDIGVTHDP